MNVPYSWLQDFVSLDITPQELAAKLTLAGLEAEKIATIGAEWDKVFVGEVLSVKRHPDADRLVLADVAAGEHRLTVVTGAPNIAEGQKVALALAGANLIDAHSDVPGKRKTLKPGKIRGIQSEGMVCSEKELGLSEEHEGILVLPDDAPVGKPLQAYLGDTVIEFEITPNLVHAFSVFGIAREAAAITDRQLHQPEVANLPSDLAVDHLVEIDDAVGCPRYQAVVIDGVTVEPSPAWMTRRLTAAGIRPVNNIVDITNYVMLELGQPLHAFDLSNVAGEQIVVRRARASENIETLDHVDRTLTPADLVITDAEKAIAIAGVMGAVNSEVTEQTTSVLLESANFEMSSVRQTARHLRLRSDASARYERGLDPELVSQASARAVALMLNLCPSATVRSWQNCYPNPRTPATVSLDISKISGTLGMEIPPATVIGVLERLDFTPSLTGSELTVHVPTYRSDVSLPEDVVEEVARIVGYDTLPATMPIGETPIVERDPLFLAERTVRTALAASGAFEARSYGVSSAEDIERWPATEGYSAVRLRNPMNAEQPYLRVSLLPSLLRDAAANRRHEPSVRFFEIGHAYLGTTPEIQPYEPTFVSAVFTGAREPFDRFNPRPGAANALDFFDLKGAIDVAFRRLGVDDVVYAPSVHPSLHPGRSAALSLRGRTFGMIGEVSPALAGHLDFGSERVAVCEFDLTALLEARGAAHHPTISIDRYLPVEQDFAVVVDNDRSAADVEQALRRNAGPLLTDVTLFDVFEGEQLGEGKKSLAWRLRFTAPDRALTDAELVKVRAKIEKGVKALVGGDIRS